ncbi:uncharacterized protein N7443_002682 [Penicillium atrosanguineum]|uniref:Uncharacterized protein n=1 Tax=Penicillium atrosanguineum TaxID=1132637 RepID=A0A9W9U411_9EURO|nr:uncharacterized protein N7443_002682 [Penicillium atrosanguineum]KAJ5310221.1 hypothetical protein N7443_002682 [Penicillium atrosanguineum]KAJ5315737.1 hypothetical protein N7476_006044 [Penicillium atrosanguineum]
MTQTEGRRVDEQQRATSTAEKQGVRAPALIGFNSLTKAWLWLGANEVDGCNRRVDGIRDRDAAALKSHQAVPRRVCRSRWEGWMKQPRIREDTTFEVRTRKRMNIDTE